MVNDVFAQMRFACVWEHGTNTVFIFLSCPRVRQIRPLLDSRIIFCLVQSCKFGYYFQIYADSVTTSHIQITCSFLKIHVPNLIHTGT